MSSFPVLFVISLCGNEGVLSEAIIPACVAFSIGFDLNQRRWSEKVGVEWAGDQHTTNAVGEARFGKGVP